MNVSIKNVLKTTNKRITNTHILLKIIFSMSLKLKIPNTEKKHIWFHKCTTIKMCHFKNVNTIMTELIQIIQLYYIYTIWFTRNKIIYRRNRVSGLNVQIYKCNKLPKRQRALQTTWPQMWYQTILRNGKKGDDASENNYLKIC